MGDENNVVEISAHRPGWITTWAICFNCTTYWVVVLEPDAYGECKLNGLECAKCGEMKGVAMGALIEKFSRSFQ